MSILNIKEFSMTYINNKKDLRIFGDIFVEKNKDKCKIYYNGKERELVSIINKKELISNNVIKIYLRIYKDITDMSYMFDSCEYLTSFDDISKYTNAILFTNLNCMFKGCKSLNSLPDISKWNTNNVTDMSYIFHGCESLSSIPDISKWNINNVDNIECIFYNCKKLVSIPDISKWNTNNVTNMSYIFYGCESLSSIPDISKWNTNNVSDMSFIFYGCDLYHHYLIFLIGIQIM